MANIGNDIKKLEESINGYIKALEAEEKNLLQERKLQQLGYMKESLSALIKEYEYMLNDIQVFSTGGGFYQAETPIENGSKYAIVTNDYINCLCIYKYRNEQEKYLEEDMIYCEEYGDIKNADYRRLYKDLYNALSNQLEGE